MLTQFLSLRPWPVLTVFEFEAMACVDIVFESEAMACVDIVFESDAMACEAVCKL